MDILEVVERGCTISDFIVKFVDLPRFYPYCQSCKNYGKLWSCPPFERSPLSDLSEFKNVTFVLLRVSPATNSAYLQGRSLLDGRLLEMEQAKEGSIAFFGGSCQICIQSKCAREEGGECRFPDRSRLSLEVLGVDVARVLKELFGVNLTWNEGESEGDAYSLLGALFH